jgi:hypothetical protein
MSQSKTDSARYDAELLGHRNNAALSRLKLSWDEFYTLSVTWPREWRAVPKDGGPVLEADDPELLREAIIADHDSRPFPRPLPGSGAGS